MSERIAYNEMSRTASIRAAAFAVLLLALVPLSGCGAPPLATGYRTYSLTDQGIAHLSFEYPASFNVRQVQLYDENGYERMDLDGPYSRATRSRTSMWVVAQRYTNPISIGDMLGSAQAVASSLDSYQLLDRSTYYFNGITAEQFSYFYFASRTDYEKKILGFTPAPTVARQVFFIYGGLNWTVAVTGDQATAEADAPLFEHLLATLTMLP